ncbi:MAG: hypothetical protein ACE5K3_03990 [bacterium]
MRNLKATLESSKLFGWFTLFDPVEGSTIFLPENLGKGWWVGALSAFYDREREKLYLYYRIRKPRGLGRGLECRISESKDGIKFTDVWVGKKEELGSPSIERASLIKSYKGDYLLYISYVDPIDNRWRIDVLHAKSPEDFDLSQRHPVFTAKNTSTQAVKDPVVYSFSGLYYMFLSYAPTPQGVNETGLKDMHATADVFNTGKVISCSALAVSSDGEQFAWLGDVLTPGQVWDRDTARVSSILYTPPLFTMFYDGKAGVEGNYEEKTGMAISFDFMHWQKVSIHEPILTSPHSSHSLRYMDIVPFEDRIYFYYEYAREDGSHELRLSVVPRKRD